MRRSRWAPVAAILLLGSPAVAAPVEAGRPEADALRVLHTWDAARAAAWSTRDAGVLRGLYVPGSTAAEADVRALREYTARDVRVAWLQTQVFAVRVLRRAPQRLRIVVVDRVVGAVSTPTRCLALPVEKPARRVVELRRLDRRWRVASVS